MPSDFAISETFLGGDSIRAFWRCLTTVNSSSQSASSITRFVYDEAGRLIGEYDSSGRPIEETLWLNDLPVAVIK